MSNGQKRWYVLGKGRRGWGATGLASSMEIKCIWMRAPALGANVWEQRGQGVMAFAAHDLPSNLYFFPWGGIVFAKICDWKLLSITCPVLFGTLKGVKRFFSFPYLPKDL